MTNTTPTPKRFGSKADTTQPGTLTITLPGSQQHVSLIPLTVGQMEQLSQAMHTHRPKQALKSILTACIQTPTCVDLDTLLACDCNALLLGMRRVTFGNACDFTTTCPACSQQDIYTVDLSQLKALPGDPQLVRRQLDDPQATHPFTFPQCGLQGYFRLCTGKQLFIDAPQQVPGQLHSTGPLLHALLQRLCRVDGLQETGMPLKVFVRDKLSAGDATAFLELYKEAEPGYDDQVELTCRHCQASFEHTLSLEAAHFFQRSHRKKLYGKQN